MTSTLVHTAIMCGFIVIQTVVFPYGLIRGAVPDIALIILCFSANHQGSYKGEISGFGSGLLLDAISLSPLGFHACIRTIVGFLFGVVRGKIFVDPIFIPVVMLIIATVIKALFAYILAAVFSPEIVTTIFSQRFAIELGMNALLAPFLFALMKSIGMIRPGTERVEYE